MALKIVHRKTGTVTILDLKGKIILGEPSNRLLEATRNLLTQGERSLLFNLAEISYLDSSGLGTFVQCYSSVLRGGGQLKLLHVPSKVRELLRTTNVQNLFEMFDEEQVALQSYTA